MLDVNFVRGNLELVRQKLAQRNFKTTALDAFSELDERRRALIRERDDLNARRNTESQEIGLLMKSGLKAEAESRRAAVRQLGEKISEAEASLAKAETELETLLSGVPNLPHDSVPVGADESANT